MKEIRRKWGGQEKHQVGREDTKQASKREKYYGGEISERRM